MMTPVAREKQKQQLVANSKLEDIPKNEADTTLIGNERRKELLQLV
jgi:hypothetical protein